MSEAAIQEYQNRLRDALSFIGQLKSKLDALQRAKNESIAIVGMGCRFPGGGDTPESFFNSLLNGVDAIQPVPNERWPADAIADNLPAPRWASLLESIAEFDANFFEISPREAETLDPQQRLLLEVVWEALEDAGQPSNRLKGSRTGVFVGISALDYQHRCFYQTFERLDGYAVTGNMMSTAAGRISFTLGLQGPCMSVDTACSSSLVAIHLACQSLRNQECELAICGGVNVILAPVGSLLMAKLNALSSDGRCKTFDARANGYVRGEGCGIIVLKRLSDAERDGDRILALIRGSGINQDGRSTGLTTPNVLAQEALLRQVLSSAKLSPDDIGYVETHGTGTPLGDPIEVDALRSVFGESRQDGTSCVLGALKTNIGHLEAAAGIAGLIKAVQVLRQGVIPKNLHFTTLNPRIDIDGTPLTIPVKTANWPRGAKPRRAGVSAFGISGTNANIILEEHSNVKAESATKPQSAYLLPISAKTPAALRELAQSFETWLSKSPELSLNDVVYTAGARRKHHEYRFAAVFRTRDELTDSLSSFVRSQKSAAAGRSRQLEAITSKIVFVFPGQGSQWLGMGKQLLAEEPIFRTTLEKCDAAIRSETGFSVLEQIAADEVSSRLEEIEVVQPLLFALQVALASLWISWGIEPSCVVGHSMGEVAAAHIAGILTLEDAVKVICRRSRLLKKISGQGAMGLVELPIAEVETAITNYQTRLSIAVSNGPRSTVVAGDPDAIDELLASLEKSGVFGRRVKVAVASHSPQVDSLRHDLISALQGLRPVAGNVQMRSTVTCNALRGPELTATYWSDNLRQPVRFSQVTRDLIRDGHTIFIEISPHPILLPSIEENLADTQTQGSALPSLRRNTDERRNLLETAGSLYTLGAAIDWSKLYLDRARVISLPTYPWQRERFWINPSRYSNQGGGKIVHPLLGIRVDSSIAPGEHTWQQELTVEAIPYLSGHRIFEDIVFPGAGYVEMALAAATAIYGQGTVHIDEMSLDQLMVVPPNSERALQAVLQKDDEGFGGIAISSRGEADESWTRHVTIRIRVDSTRAPVRESFQDIENRLREKVDADSHYARMNSQGLFYGAAFRGVQYVKVGNGEAIGRISLPGLLAARTSAYSIHPALLDACFQAASWAVTSIIKQGAFVPKEFINFRLFGLPTQNVWAYGRLHPYADQGLPTMEVVIYDEMGHVIAEIEQMRLSPLDGKLQIESDPLDAWLLDTVWRSKHLPLKSAGNARTKGAWLILADNQGVGKAVAAKLTNVGEACIVASSGSTYNRTTSHEFQLEPTDSASWSRLLGEAFGPTRTCKGVVHLLSLDATSGSEPTSESLTADLKRSCVSALRATQSLMAQGWRDLPRLYLITRGVQPVGDEISTINVSQAPLWGLGRTIKLEVPTFECTQLDLAANSSHDEVDHLVAELLSNDPEDQIALRTSGRFVARLARGAVNAVPRRDFALRPDRTYIITGGLGGLGLELAGWMVTQGARNLLLVGRSAPKPEAIKPLKAIAQSGANVRIARADVSQRDDVARVLTLQKSEMPPLAGIVHAAAILDDRTILELSEETFLRVMDAKVFGALHLHALTMDQDLDFFIMYSSAAGALGSPGQGNYASANAFLDALARSRTAMNLPAMSIAWGPFTDVGLAAARDDRGKRLAERGIEGISPETGHAILDKLLHHPRPEIAVMRLSVRQWREFFPQGANLPIFTELDEADAASSADREGSISFRKLLQSTIADQRISVMRAHVLEQLARVLRIDAARIEPTATFASQGVDSLMALELRNRLQASLGIELRATLMFTYPTIDKLVAFILDHLNLDPANTSTDQANLAIQPTTASSEPVADLGYDDLMAMLDEELSATKKGG